MLTTGDKVPDLLGKDENGHEIRLSDFPGKKVALYFYRLVELFGVWGEKSMYGRKYMGTFRTTFIISADNHTILRVIGPKEVKTKAHAEQILS